MLRVQRLAEENIASRKDQYVGGVKSVPFLPGEESREWLKGGGERADPQNYPHCCNANCRHTYIKIFPLSIEDEEHSKQEWNTHTTLSKQLQLWKLKKGRQLKCPDTDTIRRRI